MCVFVLNFTYRHLLSHKVIMSVRSPRVEFHCSSYPKSTNVVVLEQERNSLETGIWFPQLADRENLGMVTV